MQVHPVCQATKQLVRVMMREEKTLHRSLQVLRVLALILCCSKLVQACAML